MLSYKFYNQNAKKWHLQFLNTFSDAKESSQSIFGYFYTLKKMYIYIK